MARTAGLHDAYRLVHDGAVALSEVERAGIRVDVDYCLGRIAWLNEQSVRYDRRLRSSVLGRAWLARFGSAARFASGPQLQAVLYADLRVKSFRKTGSDQESVDEEALRQTGVDGINHLLRVRWLKKTRDILHSLVQYQFEGRIYPNFLLHTVVTYRSSSSSPNLQNLPKRDKEQMDICRRAIRPSPGNVLLEIDFSGIEVSVAACYHKDPAMIEYLNDPRSDMHADMGHQIFHLEKGSRGLDGFGTLRQASKNGFVFPEFYGSYYEQCTPNIACSWCRLPRVGDWTDDDGIKFDGRPIGGHLRRHGILHLSDFTEHLKQVEDDFWNRRFKVYGQWRRDWYNRYQKRGSFRMKTGFVCGGVMVRNAVINYPVQGSAFHCLLWVLIRLVRELHTWRSRVVGEVHDSALIDAHPDELHDVIRLMNDLCTVQLPKAWTWINVPMRVESQVSEVDGSWADMRVVENAR